MIDNATLFWKSWFKEGVVTVKDVLNSEGNFLSYEEFRNKFNITTNYLLYFQLISAIPSDLKGRSAQAVIPAADLSLTSASVSLNKTSFDLVEARCKNYYQLFNNYSCTVPSGIKKWQEKFPEIFVDWFNKFQDIYCFTRDNKLRQFCFRFLHRTVVTKRELKCIYCFNADSIEHTFINCTESVKLYSQIISWFNHCQDTAITLSNEKVAFHDLSLVKQYIYSSRHLQKELSLDELVKKLTTQWKLEKCI